MSRILSKEEWYKKKRRKRRFLTLIIVLLAFIILALSTFLINKIFGIFTLPANNIETIEETLSNGTIIQKQYLTPNEYSRPQISLNKVNGIVIHYTANPGTSAKNNRSYFQSLAETEATYASSHFIIGLEGEILQCIPLTEIAYASNSRNNDTISIECCHPDATGKFNEETYNSLISLIAELCLEYDLQKEDIIRHYDITEKKCPLYYVDHEDEWFILKDDVMEELSKIKNAE